MAFDSDKVKQQIYRIDLPIEIVEIRTYKNFIAVDWTSDEEIPSSEFPTRIDGVIVIWNDFEKSEKFVNTCVALILSCIVASPLFAFIYLYFYFAVIIKRFM